MGERRVAHVPYTIHEMLPPTIPTSFVPRPASSVARRFRSDLTGAFGFFAYAVLGIVLLLSVMLLFYGRILDSTRAAKDAELARAEATIDTATVDSFVRLRDRLSSGKTLLASHTAFSGFFTVLDTLVPVNVRFTSLHLTIDSKGRVVLEAAGEARSFNALAATSNAFATDGRIKNAIFSNIAVSQKDSSVSFALSATLDQKVVTFTPSPAVTSAPALPAEPVTSAEAPTPLP